MKRLVGFIALVALVLAVVFAWAIHPKGADAAHETVLPGDGVPRANIDTLRVMFLGTSLSAALPVQELEARIKACRGADTIVSVIAAGGQTSPWGALQLDRVIATRPDIVFVEFTINDADLRRDVSLADSERAHRDILEGLRRALPNADIVLLRLNRAYGLRALLRPRQARYDALLPRLAEETNAGHFDLRPQWSQAGRSLLPDGIHPSAQAVKDISLPPLTALIQTLTSDQTNCT